MLLSKDSTFINRLYMTALITYILRVECFRCITNIFCFYNLHSYLTAWWILLFTLIFRTLSYHWKFKYKLELFFFYMKKMF